MSDTKPLVKSELLPVISPFPTRSEQLVLRAEALYNMGGKDSLNVEERRDAVQYLMLMRPDLSNVALGRYFKVSEPSIRNDKELIRRRMAEDVTDKDVSIVVSDLMRGHELLMVDLARSKKACSVGTPAYLNHLKFEQEAQFKVIELLQSLGVYPKNLGNLTKTEFVYKAHVSKGGGVNTTAIASEEELKTIEAQEVKLLPGIYETDADRKIRADFAEEFSDSVPAKEPELQVAAVNPLRLQHG